MGLNEALTLSTKVLADWRVIAVTLAIFLVWAALRYVGSVYRRPYPRSRPTARIAPKPASAKRRSGARAEGAAAGE